MNTTVIVPEVQAFVAAVRGHLADLDADEQREILDGLEADLGELVAEQGPGALGDPAAYAAELRSAAGLVADAAPAGRKRSVRAATTAFLDACHARYDALVGRLPGDAGPVLAWLRPLWWVVRAWVAVELVPVLLGNGGTRFQVVPNLRGLGWLLLLAAVAGSVGVGVGRVWPGGKRGLLARLLLLALNLVAVAGAVAVLDGANNDGRYWAGYDRGYQQAQAETPGVTETGEKAGIYSNGKWVSNVFPYDAQGHPLAGVQLFDQTGKPLNVITQPEYGSPELADDGSVVAGSAQVDPVTGEELPRIFYPWTNGAAQLYNVFPLPSRVQHGEALSPTAFSEADKPAVGPFPLASVPAASLPGIATGVQKQAR
ncbi:hypothetical protein [Marmoricola sp. RAF53]|uniref:hypothetical protein n=1 Tax=Marmoricola sp. RAF53 TaxID=3233059 RepID=UPI003F9D5709